MALSRSSVYTVLHGVVKIHGNQKAAAKSLGVSAQYLSDVLQGRRELAGKLLRNLGYRKVIRYERI